MKATEAVGAAVGAATGGVAGAQAGRRVGAVVGWVAGLAAAAGVAGLAVLLMFFGGATSSPANAATVCALPDGDLEGLSTDPATRAEQLQNAAVIAERAAAAGVPSYGLVIAYAAAMQECGLRNCDYGDRDSLGLFQQRPSTGWGTPSEILDPVKASDAFFGVAAHTPNPGLLDIPGWQSMAVTEAAQAVQRSAFPDAYARWETLAVGLVKQASGAGPITGCAQTTNPVLAAGGWGWPLSPMPGVSSPFGMRLHPVLGVYKLHDGSDYGASCGTPLYAAGPGTVRVEYPAWAGNLVIIDHGGGVETSYGHMQSVSVRTGQAVSAGDPIGTVGTRGYSTGCHLHLMVRLDGVPVDAHEWLSRQIRTAGPVTIPAATGDAFSMITYNVHYGRTAAAAAEIRGLAATHNPDVICLQEAAGAAVAPPGYVLWQPKVRTVRGYGKAASPLLVSTRWAVTARGHLELTGPVYVGDPGTGPPRATPRQVVWAVLDGRMAVGCTHFTASKNLTSTRRALWYKQAEGSIRFLAGGGPRLLGGDFNAQPDSHWMSGFRRVAVVDSNRQPTHPGGRIDMVWGTGGLSPAGGVVLPKMGSDHRPVLTQWTGVS